MVGIRRSKLDRRVYASFADVLDYPEGSLAGPASECAAAVRPGAPDAARMLQEFATYAETQPLGAQQEAYTAAFDLDAAPGANAACYPYVGHHLFGESHVRSRFLVELRRRFLAHDFQADREMSDHVVVLLRFMARCDDDELVSDLIAEAMLPALATMLDEPEASDGDSERDRYRGLLRALEDALASQVPRRALSLTGAPAGSAEEDIAMQRRAQFVGAARDRLARARGRA